MKLIRHLAITCLMAFAFLPLASASEVELKSLVHSLLKVQDRIAEGDEAALPLQSHLMKLLDASISEIKRHHTLTRAEIDGLLIYAIVGTGSDVVLDVLHQAIDQEQQVALAKAVIEYRKRDRRKAATLFKAVEDKDVTPRVAPFIAFAKGNLYARRSPKKAVKYYDFVRLLAPGTLLEEATIRRLLALHVVSRDADSFIRLGKQYARRFIYSPYRRQFLAVLKSGIMSLRRRMDNEQIEQLALAMEPRFAASFYMHIIRGAVVSGHLKLASFGLDRLVDMVSTNEGIAIDPAQLRLLTAMTGITQDNPRDVQVRLASIDRDSLQPADQALLAAAKRIAATLSAPLDDDASTTETSMEKNMGPDGANESSQMPKSAEMKADMNDASSAPSSNVSHKEESKEAMIDGGAAIDAFMDDAANRLQKIDSMLGE